MSKEKKLASLLKAVPQAKNYEKTKTAFRASDQRWRHASEVKLGHNSSAMAATRACSENGKAAVAVYSI